MKGYKVADVKREKKIGVAAANLAELIQKSCKKLGFNVSCAECRLYVAEDGTQVDDDEYLATLPSQTLFILLKEKEEMITDFDYCYDLIRSYKKDYIDTGTVAKEFLVTNAKEKMKVLQRYIEAVDDAQTLLSERTEDPDWFEGLESSEKTKEQSMSKRVKDRMRGYYYKTKSALQTSEVYINSKNGRGKKLVETFLADLKKFLESDKYNETYFNRKAAKNSRICDEKGLFECGGLWFSKECLYEGTHVINPYRSREERIIFQTWNFDHVNELSRCIIPNILEDIRRLYKSNKDSEVIETYSYYLQIFTRKNLKLVHIVCHDKAKHDVDYTLTVLQDKFIRPRKHHTK